MILEKENYQVLIIRKKIKNLNLRINQKGDVTLSTPMKCPLDFIERYLQQKHSWINTHLNRLGTIVETPALQFLELCSNLVYGKIN